MDGGLLPHLRRRRQERRQEHFGDLLNLRDAGETSLDNLRLREEDCETFISTGGELSLRYQGLYERLDNKRLLSGPNNPEDGEGGRQSWLNVVSCYFVRAEDEGGVTKETFFYL